MLEMEGVNMNYFINYYTRIAEDLLKQTRINFMRKICEIYEDTTTVLAPIYRKQHKDRLTNMHKRCINAELTLVEALALISNRVAGPENIGYEPIESLVKNAQNIANITDKYNINMICYKAKRSSEQGLCWLPTHVNHKKPELIYGYTFIYTKQKRIRLNKPDSAIDKQQKNIYVRVGMTNDKKHIYLRLRITCQVGNSYITHFEEIEYHHEILTQIYPRTYSICNYIIEIGESTVASINRIVKKNYP